MLVTLGLVICAVGSARGGQSAVAAESDVRHAVEEAVRLRMGRDAAVRVEDLRLHLVPAVEDAELVATAEPGARLERPSRFTLQWAARAGRPGAPHVSAGYVIATVFVAVEHTRATRPIGRGETFQEADLVSSGAEVGAVLLQRLPRFSDVSGAKAIRDLAADDVLTRSAVAVRPLVQSGDVVAVRAVAEGVTVNGQAVAQQSGEEGDVIRVLNRDSRKALKARVIGAGRVEVIQ